MGAIAFRRQPLIVLRLISACGMAVGGVVGLIALVCALSFHW